MECWRGLGVLRRGLVMVAAAGLGGLVLYGQMEGPEGMVRVDGMVESDADCAVVMQAEVRVCYRRVQVVDTEHGRVKRSCTGWYALPRKVYKGEVQLGDYLYFEQETEEPTDEEPYLVTSFTPEPFSVLMLQAERVEFFSAGCARLHGAKIQDLGF